MSLSNGNGDASQFSIIGEHTVPETYTDSVVFEAGPYGITCVFGKTQRTPANYAGPPPAVPRVRVHMSPQHFKVMALSMRRFLVEYETQAGHIRIAPGLLDGLHLEDTTEDTP